MRGDLSHLLTVNTLFAEPIDIVNNEISNVQLSCSLIQNQAQSEVITASKLEGKKLYEFLKLNSPNYHDGIVACV